MRRFMELNLAKTFTTLAVIAGLATISAFAQEVPIPRDFGAEIRDALQSPKSAAGFEFLETLTRICLLPQSGGLNTSNNAPRYVADPSTVPPREVWYADSRKVFDSLYFVGGKLHTSWALTTSDGIIIIDTIFPYNSEELIIGGLEKLGLDPNHIKYVIISHAHGDHIGGAKLLQERYDTRVVMGGADWGLVETSIATRPWLRCATLPPPTAWRSP
jgi:metallo-beta-lactamase class B